MLTLAPEPKANEYSDLASIFVSLPKAIDHEELVFAFQPIAIAPETPTLAPLPIAIESSPSAIGSLKNFSVVLIFKPFTTVASFIAFSCAKLTASVSAVPAFTPEIVRALLSLLVISILSPSVSLPMVMCLVSEACFIKLLAATCSWTSCLTSLNCPKFTASVLSAPACTPVIFLLPASIPEVVILGPLPITKPVASKVLFPVCTLSITRSLARSNFMLLSFSLLVRVRFVLSAAKSIGLVELTLVLFLPLTESSQFGFVESCRAFSCATFTASVSLVPAATFTICLVLPFSELPILSAP